MLATLRLTVPARLLSSLADSLRPAANLYRGQAPVIGLNDFALTDEGCIGEGALAEASEPSTVEERACLGLEASVQSRTIAADDPGTGHTQTRPPLGVRGPRLGRLNTNLQYSTLKYLTHFIT